MANLWNGTGVDSWLGVFNYSSPITASYDWIRYTAEVNDVDDDLVENNSDKISINPNPAVSVTTIGMPIRDKNVNLYIYNVLGQKVYECNVLAGDPSISLDVEALGTGVFLVVSEGLPTKKLMVVK